MGELYPDIRAEAKAAVEKKIFELYGVTIDADRVYYNFFSPVPMNDLEGRAPVLVFNNGDVDGRPTYSRTLTELVLAEVPNTRAPVAADAVMPNQGIHTEGMWATEFNSHNKVQLPDQDHLTRRYLSPAQVLHAIQQLSFFSQYRNTMQTYWQDYQGTLQVLREMQVIDYMDQQRRSDNRTLALGIRPEYQLSNHALEMIEEATGVRDPDLPAEGAQVYRFNVHGYQSTDMVCIKASNGRIVLLMPGESPAIREYANIDQMRAAFRRMIGTADGRQRIATHFRFPTWGWGATTLDSIAANTNLDSYIFEESYRETFNGKLSVGDPTDYGRSLLSDKAVAMVASAAGYAPADSSATGMTAHRLDIDGYASDDIIWLRGPDGRIVLLMPKDPIPVREYRDLAEMQACLARMAATDMGRQQLASHFPAHTLDSTRTFQGIRDRLSEIGNISGVASRFAADPERNKFAFRSPGQEALPNVFYTQIAGTHKLELEHLDLFARGNWYEPKLFDRWLQDFRLRNRDFYQSAPADPVCRTDSVPPRTALRA